MSKYQIKFIRKLGKLYTFEIRGKKIYIEDMYLTYNGKSSCIKDNNGSPAWHLKDTYIPLKQFENAAGEQISTNEWFIGYMKANQQKWKKNHLRNELQLTKGSVKIVNQFGEVLRERCFEDRNAKNNLVTYFINDIRNLPEYCVEISYR